MPTAKVRRATKILGEFGQVHAELIGKSVILTDGKAGTVERVRLEERVRLDEMHGLRISIRGHDRKWPVSIIKFARERRRGPTHPRPNVREVLSPKEA
jgi:hypothetical protein